MTSINERDVDVEVVGELDGAHEMHDLALEVEAAGLGDHEVVLHGDGEALAHDVAGEGALALGEDASGGLVGDARGHALVEAVDVLLELLVGVLEVHVGKDVAGKGGVGSVGDEVDTTRKKTAAN